jgi:hypothetical protein
MAITIVNLTLLKVSRKIDNLLSIYQANTRKIAWNYYDFRQKLLTYVLGKITNHYVAIEAENISSISSESLCCSTEEQLQIEELIQQGIYHLINLRKHPNLLCDSRRLDSSLDEFFIHICENFLQEG